MIAAASAEKLAELQGADMALHRRICELSGNRQIVRAHESIDTEVQMLMAFVDLDRESPMESALIHVPLVEAIASGDVETSVAALEDHLRETWAFVRRKYEEAGLGGHLSTSKPIHAARRSGHLAAVEPG